ncbi:MAG: lysylphosphatidylglycerol synthase transmembrane domain-containing protein [Actinomycetota bacterium]|nr:lysylphosphatidylglycerol synthase transmembrane domain-containing protein [Actinomycetota bacterium]
MLRLASTVVMIYVLLTKVDWTSVTQIGRRGFGLIIISFLTTLLGIVLSGYRWQRVLDALEVPSRIRDLVELQLAGMFAGNFLPSTVGGDVVRATWLAKLNKLGADSAASVVLERLTGWLVLPLLVLAGMLIDPGVLHLGGISKVILSVALLTLSGLVAVVAIFRSSNLTRRVRRIKAIAELLQSLYSGLGKLQRKPSTLLPVFGWAFMYQVCALLASIFAAQALHISIGWREMLVFIPTVAMLQVVPLTIGGLGIREGALVLMLHPLGIGSAQAIAFGLLVYAINIGASLLGAPSFALGSSRIVARYVATVKGVSGER